MTNKLGMCAILTIAINLIDLERILVMMTRSRSKSVLQSSRISYPEMAHKSDIIIINLDVLFTILHLNLL